MWKTCGSYENKFLTWFGLEKNAATKPLSRLPLPSAAAKISAGPVNSSPRSLMLETRISLVD
jgi:hypothetical protein